MHCHYEAPPSLTELSVQRSQPSAPVVNGSGNASTSAPGPVTPSSYSTTGAFNGTGLALAEESFEIGGHGATNMYFQHHTGQLRVIELAADGSWKGGSPAEVVAFNAKNGTPISVVSYALGQKAAVGFYIQSYLLLIVINPSTVAHLLR